MEIFKKFAKSSNLLHAEPAGDGLSVKNSYDIIMKSDADLNNFVSELNAIDDLSEVVIIAAKNDVDY